MKITTIAEVLKELYSDDILSRWAVLDLPLYYYFKETCSFYYSKVNNIADKEFCIVPDDVYFKGLFTKKRLQNLVGRVIEAHLRILQYCYKGDYFQKLQIFYPKKQHMTDRFRTLRTLK